MAAAAHRGRVGDDPAVPGRDARAGRLSRRPALPAPAELRVHSRRSRRRASCRPAPDERAPAGCRRREGRGGRGMTHTYDVVVVGGRVAGASTALLLARAGARVALVERSSYGTDTVSTHGLMRAGVLQLSRWGVLPAVTAAGTPPIRETTFHYADGESVRVAIRATAAVPALYAPRRYLLDRILVDAATEAGADARHETTVTGLLRDDGGRVTGVLTRDRSDREGELRATLVVGADGIRSMVAKHVDAPLRRQGTAGSAFLYRYYADLYAAGYEWAYGPGAAAGLLPTNDGVTCVFVATAP